MYFVLFLCFVSGVLCMWNYGFDVVDLFLVMWIRFVELDLGELCDMKLKRVLICGS